MKKNQTGMSLIEIMISMAIGLMLLGGTLQIYMVTKNSQNLQNGMSEVQENGRYGIHALRENILMAGFSPSSSLVPFDPAGTEDDVSDEVTIRYESTVDCLGEELLPAAAGVAVNRLFVDVDNQTLQCDGNGGENTPAVTLVEGIENMQVLYGHDNDNDSIANRYISATEVTDWGAIVSVRIALLAQSNNIMRVEETKTFRLLDAPPMTLTDRLARRVFTTTIPLRNVML